jgi:flap endonuclease-1
MGIPGLTKLIADNAPDAIKEGEDIKNFFGRLIAIDASQSLYQFLVAVRTDKYNAQTLTNQVGETTSHLTGLFYRTIKMLTHGLKPVFVFDGKAPELKADEIARRRKKREENQIEKEKALNEGDLELLKKLNKRSVRVTPEMNADAKPLLKFLGVPIVESPYEAEAQCAALCKASKVYAVASEDMDSLTCGTPLLIRNLTYSEVRKAPLMEISIDKVLQGLNLTMDQFIDLCILLGCDYSAKIKGIGPVKALRFIRKYGSIEKLLASIDKTKYIVPDRFPYQEIRAYFKNPGVTPVEECNLSFTDPDEEGLIEFLCKEKGFQEDRVRAGVAKVKASRQKGTQTRITNFFQVIKSTEDETPKTPKTPKTPTTSLKASGSAKKVPAGKKKDEPKVSSPNKRAAQASIKKPQKKSKKK